VFQNIISTRFVAFLLIVFGFLFASVNAAAIAVDPSTKNPRHTLAEKTRERLVKEITGRKNSIVALANIAREYLEREKKKL
jgi:hypothetical protein